MGKDPNQALAAPFCANDPTTSSVTVLANELEDGLRQHNTEAVLFLPVSLSKSIRNLR